MKTIRKFLSFIMAVVILFSGIIAFPVTALDSESTVTAENDDLTVSGTNSTGNLIANALSDVQAEQEANSGYNVFSATVEDNVVILEVETLEDCTVVVGIYNEAGTTLVASGYSPLYVGETTAVVEIETTSMPQYFYFRAFLVDSNTFRPISTSYECPNYTQEMQEFLAKTTEDFEADRVVNFDDSIDNNFAVYDDATIVIPESTTGNDVASVDDETGVYVIENADESITSLQAGDIFAYEYSEDNILIVKVASITIDGTTATITGEETTLEEVFEYVKIDTTASTEDATVDTSTLEEGATYEGIVESADTGDTSTYGVSAEGSLDKAFSFNFADVKIGSDSSYVQLTGGLEYKIKADIKVYISWSYQYLELKIDNSLTVSLSVAAKVEGEIPLATIGFAPVPGVYIEFTPAVVIRFSAKMEFSATISMTVGFRVSNEEGMKNITTSPEVTTTMKIEGAIYIGLSLEPKVKIIHDSIASVGMVASIGAEIRATMDALEVLDNSIKHSCADCIDGDIVGIIDLSFNVKLLSMESLTWKLTLVNETFKIADFYYSVDNNEFGFSTCPYLKYKVSVTVVDFYGNPINGALVGDEHITNSDGEVVLYLTGGTHNIIVQKSEYKSVFRTIKLQGNDCSIKVTLNYESVNLNNVLQVISLGGNHNYYMSAKTYGYTAAVTADGNLYTWGGNDYGQLGNGEVYTSSSFFPKPSVNSTPQKIMSEVTSVSAGISHVGAIKNGDLYMWGGNANGQLGVGVTSDPVATPQKIMSNVIINSVGYNDSAAITADGSLYMWGRNAYGQLGNGTTTDAIVPIKIMSNVAQVSLGVDHSAAITTDGSLYMWGRNNCGQLGDGTTIDSTKPIKIMSNVAQVSLGMEHSAAVTTDGNLYVWGNNDCGQLGTGNKLSYYTPKKIMSNISSVELGFVHSSAITTDGNLYLWGGNSFKNYNGLIGNGEVEENAYHPVYIMSNVVQVNLGNGHSAATTSSGELYMWGGNSNGQLGNGNTTNSYQPIKIMSNIKVPSLNYSNYYDADSFYTDSAIDNINTYTTDSTVPTEKTAEFTGLLANEVYNFYVMKDRESESPLGADNLLYMTQVVSDAEGNLSVTYTPTTESTSADIFLKAMSLIDINSSNAIMFDMLFNRSQQYVRLNLSHNGNILKEGIDYEIKEGSFAKSIGTYTATITGIGDYTGTLTTTYEVYCGHDYNTGKCIMCGNQKGDADANGEINADDYVLMANASAAAAVIEDDVARCDMNGDGVVDGFDAIILDLKNNNMLQSTVTGDANGDGMVDDNDYTFLSSVINGETDSTDNVTRLCDLNSDGAITTDDLTMIESYLNGTLDWA